MAFKVSKKIYLDYASFTPRSSKGSIGMGKYWNPSSIHGLGTKTKEFLNKIRQLCASTINAQSDEIIFTSSGTMSNNTAILGVVEAYNGDIVPHIISSSVEHASVLEVLKNLESEKRIELTLLKSDETGNIELKELKESIQDNTILICVMMVNNEVGTLFDIPQVSKVIRDYKKESGRKELAYPYLLVDACQAANILDINVQKNHADLLSINGNKIYSPGSALLYKKRGIKLKPIFFGGNQEQSLVPGTENTQSIVSFSDSLKSAQENTEKYFHHTKEIKDFFESGLEKIANEYQIKLKFNSSKGSAPTISHFTLDNIPAELLVLELDAKGICVSSMSACKEGDEDVSHVLAAIGAIEKGKENIGGIRFSFGLQTKKSDIKKALKALDSILKKYKGIYF